jgi:hypothetical protein
MNEAASFGDDCPAGEPLVAMHKQGTGVSGSRGGWTMSGMTAFLIAVSGVSLVCYWLMTRAQNRRAARGSSSDGPRGGQQLQR